MKAIRYLAPNQLALEQLAPLELGAGQIRVAPVFVGICGTDLSIAAGGMARVKPPVTLGHEMVARVLELAPGVSIDAELDELVFINPLISCHNCASCERGLTHVCERLGLYGIDADGGLAEELVVAADRVHRLPTGASAKAFALTEPVSVACHMIARAGASTEDSILIVGGGPIGILVAEVLRATGHSKILVAEPNPQRQALIAGLGFEVVGDLTAETVAASYDLAFELTGIAAGLAIAVAGLTPGGRLLLGGLPHHPVEFNAAQAAMKELTVIGSRVYREQDIARAIELIGQGAIRTDQLVTSVVKLDQAIGEGFEKLQHSRDEMKILIEIGS
jgi:(R,R)-butanediol dehydrogenase/meso-butanediol dehydrogenase/diacetyl reductase